MEIWKIGTNISSYLKKYFKYIKSEDKNKTFIFRKTNDIYFCYINESTNHQFIFNNGGTLAQALKIFIFFGLIKPIHNSWNGKENENQIISKTYKIIDTEETFLTNFYLLFDNLTISKVKSYIESFEIEEDENDYFQNNLIAENNFLNENQIDFLKSPNFAMAAYSLFYTSYHLLNPENQSSPEQGSGFWDILDILKTTKNKKIFFEKSKEFLEYDLSFKNYFYDPFLKTKKFEIEKDFLENNIDFDSKIWNLKKVTNFIKNGITFKIPIMQRKYVWDKSLILFLIEDLEFISNDKSKNNFHHLGSIIFKNIDDEYIILDGQQRLISLLIIFVCIYKIYWESREIFVSPLPYKELFKPMNDEETLLSKYFIKIKGNKEYDSLIQLLKVEIKPKSFYSNSSTSPNTQIIKNYYIAYEYFKKELENKNSTDLKQKYLDEIFTNLFYKIVFTSTKNNRENSSAIFEKLNDRSKNLNKMELLKNFFLNFIDEKYLDSKETEILDIFYQKFETFFEIDNKSIINEPKLKEFIIFYINSNIDYSLKSSNQKFRFSDPQLNSIFFILSNKKILSKNKISLNDFSVLMEEFEVFLNRFDNLTSIEKYTNIKNENYVFADILRSFKNRVVYLPLISFIIYDLIEHNPFKSDPLKEDLKIINEIRKTLIELEKFEIFTQISNFEGQSLTNKIISVLQNFKERIKNYKKEIFKILKDILSDDEIMGKLKIPSFQRVEKTLQTKQIKPKVSIVILNRIEFYKENSFSLLLNDQPSISYLASASLEHIMPQTSSTEWDFHLSNDLNMLRKSNNNPSLTFKDYVDYIGNLIIINKNLNASLNNSSLLKKLDIYYENPKLKKSILVSGFENKNFKINKLTNKFNLSEILKRSEQIAKILSVIYNFNN